jgi:hypothetical protein
VPDIRCGRFGRLPEASVRSAAIAQLVEHVIRNDGVTGSSPVCGTGYDYAAVGSLVCFSFVVPRICAGDTGEFSSSRPGDHVCSALRPTYVTLSRLMDQ